MRHRSRRLSSFLAVAALALAGCTQADPAADDAPADADEALVGDADAGDAAAAGDPNDDVVDGVYRGLGVVLPVPAGWALDQGAFLQGVAAAVSDDQDAQLTARAVDINDVTADGVPVDLDSVLEGLRTQVGATPDVDEAITLAGATRAHRLTYLDLPALQDGVPDSSATIVLAEDARGLLGEFVLAASSDIYDEDLEAEFLATAGFDPDSSPPAPLPLPDLEAPEDELG